MQIKKKKKVKIFLNAHTHFVVEIVYIAFQLSIEGTLVKKS